MRGFSSRMWGHCERWEYLCFPLTILAVACSMPSNTIVTYGPVIVEYRDIKLCTSNTEWWQLKARHNNTTVTLMLAFLSLYLSLSLEITGACEISERACKSPGRWAGCSLISVLTLRLGRRPWVLVRARALNTRLCCEETSLLMLGF